MAKDRDGPDDFGSSEVVLLIPRLENKMDGRVDATVRGGDG